VTWCISALIRAKEKEYEDIGKVSMRTKQNKTYLNVRIQPPVLTLIHVAVANPSSADGSANPANRWIPASIIGFLLGLGALMAFRSARRIRDPHGPLSRLVTSGVYRFTRNPVNLGFVLILVGILLNAGSYWGILLAAVLVILFSRLVVEREEGNLAQKFGDEYSHYKLKVRRWI
jgi:protein-S-isoprenylcysteine O-methyltransferase Ste14